MRVSVQSQPVSSVVLKRGQAEEITENFRKEEVSIPAAMEAEILKMELTIKLTADNFIKAWAEMEKWKPSENKTSTQNVQDLRERYMELEEYIQTLGPEDKELQELLLTKLYSYAVQHLETLLSTQYSQLIQFLANNGQESAISVIKDSLLLFIMGKISEGDMEWPEQILLQGILSMETQDELEAAKKSNANGMLQYSRSGKTNLRTPNTQELPVSDELQRKAKRSDQSSGVTFDDTKKSNSLQSLFPRPFTPMELEKSNAFARHMMQHGISESMTAENVEKEEWIGLKSGVAWLKGQSFARADGVSRTMGQVMQSTIDNQIFSCIHQAGEALKKESISGSKDLQRFAPLQRDAVYSSFNYVTSSFQKNHDAKSTILNSIFYITEVLKKKEQNPDYQSMLRYQPQTQGKDGEKKDDAHDYFYDNKKWLQQIESSWNEFNRSMGMQMNIYLDFSRFQQQYSLWAQSMSSGKKNSSAAKASMTAMMGWCYIGLSGVIALLILLNR